MKVAYMLGSLNTGGIEILALDIFSSINPEDVELIGIHRKKGTLYKSFIETQIPLIELNFTTFFFLKYVIKLRRLIVSQNISIIHCHTAMDALLSYIAKTGLKTKLVISFHGRYWNSNDINGLSTRFICRNADKICFVSHAQKKFYLAKFNLKQSPKMVVLYNGISLRKFDLAKSVNMRKQLNIRDDSLLLGTVGNFTSGKDHMTICKFLRLLKSTSENFHFLFIGEKASQEPDVYNNCVTFCEQNELSQQVHFLGSRHDVPSILRDLDAFIYSTAHDTFGICLVEAMYMKIPVFVNDYEVMMEITRNGKYAEIYKSGDEADLFNKFEHVFLNINTKRMNKLSFSEFVRDNYSIETHLHHLNKIYQELAV
ncbi:MAG: glycosyltransferase family 4 protein [Clostridiaceae bacterium]|nr:glycosyltransferase family 4 protein [Clostridiaceae bacterium]